MIKMVHELIKDIERNGVDKGRGQPEPLKYELTGYLSRRIDLANRLVYKVDGDKLYVVQCGYSLSSRKIKHNIAFKANVGSSPATV